MIREALQQSADIVGPAELNVIDFIKKTDSTLKLATKDKYKEPTVLKDMDTIPEIGDTEPYAGGLAEAIYTGNELAATLPPDMLDRELVLSRIRSIVMLARAENGEEFELGELTRGTTGVDAVADDVSDEYIAWRIEEINPLLVKAGLKKGYVSASRDKYLEGAILGSDKILAAYEAEQTETAIRLAKLFGDYLPKIKSKAIPIKMNNPYRGYSTTDRRGRFVTYVNTNEQLYQHTLSSLGELETEEDVHAINFFIWMMGIADRAITATSSVSTLVTPEIPQFEAVPPMIKPLVLTEDRSLGHRIEALQSEIKTLVYHKALVEVNTTDTPTQKVINKAKTNNPLVLPELVESVVLMVRDQPAMKGYVSSYIWGQLWANRLMQEADPEEDPALFLDAAKILLEKPRLLPQLDESLGALL
jgi:hypothetical protein